MARKAPTNATELFGDAYADGPSRATPSSSSSSSSSSTIRSFGPFTAWDADELGKTIDIHIIDDALAADVNAALVALALDERAHARGMCVSNLGGGFHSTPDVFERRKCAATEALRMRVEEALRDATAKTRAKRRAGRGDGNVISTSWVNVCDSASAQGHGLHNHAHAVWSGVYYASTSSDRADEEDEAAGDEPGDLLIRITAGGVNPLAKKNEKSGYCRYYRVVPKTSRLVIFPSWVLHGVLANGVGNVDAAPRVSFAFNSGETDVTFD
jgi:uncharacterized protein (TIGR02466 family)